MEAKFAFFGTDKFSVAVLEELEKKGLTPSLVVAAPDRPKGRGLLMTPPETKVWAQERNIPVSQPENLKQDGSDSNANDSHLAKLKEMEFFVVASYGKIIPQYILDIPKHGALNVHPSLLPQWRGASPVETQILNDENEVGVTIMLLDAKMDHGPILDQEFVEPPYWPMKGSELQDLLAHTGGAMLARVIPEWLEGNIDAQEQDHDLATFSKKISKEDGLIDLKNDPYQNLLKIRAFNVWPRSYFFDKNKKRIVITDAEVENKKLVIKTVIPEGKKEMTWEQYSQ